jgi:hypothetical protein
VAKNTSAKIALGEALRTLIGAGILVPRAANSTPRMDLAWTTGIAGGSGSSSGWRFEDLAVPMPGRFSLSPSRAAEATHLTDGVEA